MSEKKRPTKTQIDLLMSDWLCGSRDGETFIHKDTRGAIRNTVSKNGNLSDYAIGNLERIPQDDILKQAREIAQGVVNGMTDKVIKVSLGSAGSFTDGEQINIATDYFDDASLSVGDKIDILTGYSIHEACHVNHSDFGQLERLCKEDPAIADLKKDIMNIIEDERIEHLLGESIENGGDGMPGLSDYLGCCKRRSFGNYEKNLKAENVNLQKRVPKFLNSLLKAVRYPSALTEREVTDNFNELDAARKTLTPFPKSITGVESAADRIIDIMRDMMNEDLEEKSRCERNREQSGSDRQQQQSSPSSSSNSQGETGRQNQEQGSQPDGQGARQPTRQEIDQALKDAVGDSDTRKLLEQIKKSIEQPKAGYEKNASCMKGPDGDAVKDFINGDCEKNDNAGGTNGIKFIRRAKGEKRSYDISLQAVKKWVPAMAKALRCKTLDRDYELMGMKSGKLNTNKLVSLKTGNVNIFTRSGSITADSACICILIDESGSMKHNGRQKGARDTAVLINEAVKHIPNLELFVYGFTNNELNIYCERKKADRWALGSTKANGGTPTAAAMETAARRIRRLTQSDCLMLVITDGYPNDTHATVEQDKLLAKKGFVPVGVDIAGAEQTSNIFKESISTSDMNRLAPFLGQIVKKHLMRSIRSHDSL